VLVVRILFSEKGALALKDFIYNKENGLRFKGGLPLIPRTSVSFVYRDVCQTLRSVSPLNYVTVIFSDSGEI
jgi:hypothetical protein